GLTSRLYQALVETQLAVSVTSNCDQFRDPGLFNVYASIEPNIDPRRVEEVILDELRRVAEEGLPAAEIERARQQILAQVAYNRDGTASVAAQLSEAEAVADWRFYRDFASRIARTELDMGATLVVLENHATPTLALRGSLRAGSYFEPRDKPGLARLTAEMLARGTRRRTKLQLAGALEAVGAELDFQTDPFAVGIAGRALAKDMPLLLGTLAEELREPAFPADELEKLKQQTVAAIREQQANTRARAYERFTQLIFDPNNPFYQHAGERLSASISAITVADVRRFYDECYGGRSLILGVAGAVNAAEVCAQFQTAFGAFAGPESIEVDVNDPAQQETMQREVVLL